MVIIIITRADHVLAQYWFIVCDDGPILNQHMVNVSCWSGYFPDICMLAENNICGDVKCEHSCRYSPDGSSCGCAAGYKVSATDNSSCTAQSPGALLVVSSRTNTVFFDLNTLKNKHSSNDGQIWSTEEWNDLQITDIDFDAWTGLLFMSSYITQSLYIVYV